MPLHHLEHFLIQTADLEGTRDWYVNTLGMRVGPSPDFKFPVVWLYIGDTDVLHLTVGGKNVSENRKAYLGHTWIGRRRSHRVSRDRLARHHGAAATTRCEVSPAHG